MLGKERIGESGSRLVSEGLKTEKWIERLKLDPIVHPLYGRVMWREVRTSEQQPKTCNHLLQEFYEKKGEQIQGKVLNTSGIEVKNSRGNFVPAEVFNISGPFQVTIGGTNFSVIAFRRDPPGVEGRGDVCFGILQGDSLVHLKEARAYPERRGCKIKGCEDPKIALIGNSWVLGMTEVGPYHWNMSFHRDGGGNDLDQFQKIATGPKGMKGIVLAELQGGENGQTLIFTRSEEKFQFLNLDGHLASVTIKRVGWIVVDSNAIGSQRKFQRAIADAQPIEGLFAWGEWGGVNDAILLEDGKIGVLGHVARQDKEENKHYYPITFEFDPQTGRVEGLQIIASKENFSAVRDVSKRVRGRERNFLRDVVYFNGMEAYETEDGRIMIRYYGGAGDKVPVIFERENHFSARPRRVTVLSKQT